MASEPKDGNGMTRRDFTSQLGLAAAGVVVGADLFGTRVGAASQASNRIIGANDRIYVADHQSNAKLNPGFKRGIRVGSAKDGTVTTLIPGLGADPETQSVGEGVVADAKGNVWWSETSGMNVRKFVLK